MGWSSVRAGWNSAFHRGPNTQGGPIPLFTLWIVHQAEPGKVWVFFDCSTDYRGTSPNNQLISEPVIQFVKVCRQQDWCDETNSRRTLQKNNIQELKSAQVQKERALGVVWNIKTDTFGFKISLKDKPATKRRMLSELSSLYDPLGLTSPLF